MDKIANKTVLVTGGAVGLGFQYCHEVLRHGAQAVALLDLSTSPGVESAAKLQKEFGQGRALFFECDVTNHEQFKETFHKVVKAFNGLDIVINNAGILDDHQWQKSIAINLTALVNCTYVALDYMGKHKGGKGGTIVNIASIVGLAPIHTVPVYTATKHGVIGFSRSLQGLYDITGVRVLVLCPGVTPTALIGYASEKGPYFVKPERIVEEMSHYPTQTVEDVGNAMMNLIQKGENGAVWVIEGGKKPYALEFAHYSKKPIAV